MRSRQYLTNMVMHLKPIVAEAIEVSGRRDIHIDDMPMPKTCDWYEEYNDGYKQELLIGERFSIYLDPSSGSECCSDFWTVYDALCEEPKWRTYLALCKD